jgi:Tol biopolymer transport system component
VACYDSVNRVPYIYRLGISLKGETPQALPPLDGSGEAFELWSWSPDGKWLAGTIMTGAGTSAGIAIYNLEAQQYRRLTNSGRTPRWLSSSRELLFRDSGKILLQEIESGRVHEVLSISPDDISGFSISRDNRWIYFSRESAEADIWMLTLNPDRK